MNKPIRDKTIGDELALQEGLYQAAEASLNYLEQLLALGLREQRGDAAFWAYKYREVCRLLDMPLWLAEKGCLELAAARQDRAGLLAALGEMLPELEWARSRGGGRRQAHYIGSLAVRIAAGWPKSCWGG